MSTSPKILIVDDDPNSQELLCELLYGYGYHLFTASNGCEAVDLALQHTPDLILLDVMMPDLDGYEVCQRIRSIPDTAEVPIVMVTALDDQSARVRGIQAGADDFMSKPYDRFELRTRVQTITRLNRYRRIQTEQAKFAWIAAHSDDGYLLIEHGQVVVFANPTARRWFELGDQPLDAMSFSQVLHGRFQQEPAGAWATWPDHHHIPRYLVRPEQDLSAALWLSVEQLALPGHTSNLLIRLRDVTSMIDAQRCTWQLHTAIAHKLRTPLVGVLGGIELIATDVADLGQDRLSRMVQIARQSATRLSTAVEEVLRFVDVQSGRWSGHAWPLHQLPTIIQQISTTLQLEPVKVSMNPTLAEITLGISTAALETMMLELLNNAQKFHPQRRPHIEIGCHQINETNIQLFVQDDGIRVAPELIVRLGTPYFQVEKQPTGEIPGLGLGLTMVSMLIWQIGGQIQFINRTDCLGLRVELTIPIAQLNEEQIMLQRFYSQD